MEQYDAAVSKLLAEVKSKESNVRKEAASRLRDYVVAQNRELSVEAFSRFMSEINKCAFCLGFPPFF